MRLRIGSLITLVALSAASAQIPGDGGPSDEQIREILADRVDAQKRSVGIVVGVVDESGRRIIAHGKTAADGAPVDGDTVFEIGSVTKVFTALLLADMVGRGEIAYEDEIDSPPGITLDHLTRQTSGLPRLPSNLKPSDPRNPYADYRREQMLAYLADYQLTRRPGEKYEYSNLGVGLLGDILSTRARTDYESLTRERILDPLGIDDTAIDLSPELQARLARGHNAKLKAVANWDLPTFAGAGALRSTANDMLTFMAAAAGLQSSPLDDAFAALMEVRAPTGMKGVDIARGWHIALGEPEMIWHNGGTGGYRSFAGYAPDSKTAVVVLSNSIVSVDDLGRRLLDGKTPLMQAPEERQEISLQPVQLERFVGRYQLAPNFILTISREEDRLFAQATGQGRARIFPESETKFFYKATEAQLSFRVDSTGAVTSLTLHQGGRSVPANRID